MRIGLVNEYFPPHAIGGAEWSTYYLGRRLAEAGHTVVAVTPNYGAPAYEECDGIRIHRFWFPQKPEKGQLARSSLLATPLFYLYSALQTCRIARREQLQVLHAHNVYSMPGAYLAGRWLRIPTVVTLRDIRSVCVGCLCLHRQNDVPDHCSLLQHWRCMKEFDLKYNVGKSRSYRIKWYLNNVWRRLDLQVRNYLLRRVDHIITISDGLKDIYVHAGRFPPERAQTIYNPPPIISDLHVDSETQRALRRKYGLEGKKVVLAVGKMSFGKGSDVLIAAIPRIIRAVPDALVAFAGRANSLIIIPDDVQPHVRTLGMLPHEEVLKLYALADVVAFPVVGPEGHGRVLLEAMSLGRPVVATRVGGIPETVKDGVSGFLVERSNPQALAEAIVRVLQDPNLGAQMGGHARRILAEKFDEEEIVNQTVAMYRAVLARPHRSGRC